MCYLNAVGLRSLRVAVAMGGMKNLEFSSAKIDLMGVAGKWKGGTILSTGLRVEIALQMW